MANEYKCGTRTCRTCKYDGISGHELPCSECTQYIAWCPVWTRENRKECKQPECYGCKWEAGKHENR